MTTRSDISYDLLAEACAANVVVLLSTLHQMLYDQGGAPDHMTACERTMGATHPCTCGADQARAMLVRHRRLKATLEAYDA
jgi:hypothetical protein